MGRNRSFKYSSTFYRRKQRFLELRKKVLSVPDTNKKQNVSIIEENTLDNIYQEIEKGRMCPMNDHVKTDFVTSDHNYSLETEYDSELFEPGTAPYYDKIEDNTSLSIKLGISLRRWALKNKISHCALNDLLKELSSCGIQDLPNDCRSLLKTPRSVSSVVVMGKGHYWHNGIEDCLREMLIKVNEPCVVKLNFHVDGLPINKSSKHQFWPILTNIANMSHIRPHAVAIFYGETKPPSADIFLKEFAKELIALLNYGIIINDCLVQVKINAFICDTPARSFIKCVVSFNAYHGCIKCTVRGEYFKAERHMSFPQLDCPKRTDSGFRMKIDSNHHMNDIDGEFIISPLEELPIDIIKDVVVADSLHLLDLGVMKKCLTMWVNGSKTFKMKFFANQISLISSWLLSCNNFLPEEIHRSVRQLDCLSFWKATEFRTFMLYLGPIILKDHLSQEIYRHYLLLFCAVTLCSADYYSEKLDLAEKLFRDYVEGFISIYGVDSVSSNIHNLIHVTDDVKRFGSLPVISSYPFENMLGTIKNLLRSGNRPLAQIAKRLSEISKANSELNFEYQAKSYPLLLGEESDLGKVPLDSKYQVFKTVVFSENLKLSSNVKNKWFLTQENKIIKMLCAYKKENQIYIHGSSLVEKYADLFDYPFKSSYLNIYVVHDNIFSEAVSYRSDDIKCKLISLDYNQKLVFLPLLHSLKARI